MNSDSSARRGTGPRDDGHDAAPRGSAVSAAWPRVRASSRDTAAVAARYLESAGYRILDRDRSSDSGHLDLIAAHQGMLVAVEVTARSARRRQAPVPVPSRARARQMRRLTIAWMAAHGRRCDQIRADLVTVTWDGTGGYTIEHVKAVD